jgi:hypothetical protein
MNYKDLVLHILEIIEYKDNKEEFVNKFIGTIQAEAVIALLQTLSADVQQEVQNAIAQQRDKQQEVYTLLKGKFSDEQMQQAFVVEAQKALDEWLEALESTLSQIQKEKLEALFKELLGSSQPTENSQ